MMPTALNSRPTITCGRSSGKSVPIKALGRKSMKKIIKLGLILALACLVVVSLIACGDQTAESQTQYIEVTRGDIVLSVSVEGNLSLPWHRELAFGTSGTIAEINVKEGDSVVKGQVLASLDITSLEQAVKTEELGVETAEIDLELAANDYRQITYPYTYQTLIFDVPQSVLAIGDAQRELNEALEVMQLELGLSGEQYWEVRHKLEEAQDDLIRARERLARGYGADVFQSEILAIKDYWTLRAAQLEMEKAQVALDEAKNDLDKAKADMEHAIILAPFDGVISAVDVKEGDKLSSMYYATTIIMELIDPTIMELEAEVDEIDIPDVELGQRAIIEVDALPALQLEGMVTYINLVSTVESGVVLYEVTVGFDVPPDAGLRSGMSATAEAIIDERSQVLLMPNRAIKYDSQGNSVVKVMVDGQIQERAVVVGMSDGYQTEIVDGLDEGETVVIEVSAR